MRHQSILSLAIVLLFTTQTFAFSPFSIIYESVLAFVSNELKKAELADYDKIADSLNQLEEKEIYLILKQKGILAGEHHYNAEKLWQLHIAAQRLGTHSNIALCIRRANKFQTHFEAKARVKDEILNQVSYLPKWINFNDLNVIENKYLGASNYEINRFFRSIHTRFDDDIPWCAAYVGAKMKEYDPSFQLPAFPYKAACYGGFNDSNFNFGRLQSFTTKYSGRYQKMADLEYLPYGQTERYRYTMDDFRDKNKIPFGAIVVFKRQGGGHVGFVVGAVKDVYVKDGNLIVREGIVILGGNQNDAVQFEVFYDLDKIRAVTIPTNFPKEEYSAIPEITSFYDLPEFYERNGVQSNR